MKDLIKHYLDQRISRRHLISGLTAMGVSAASAKAMAQSLAPAAPASAGRRRDVTGSGGALFVQQLKAAGVKHVFFNPATGDAPVYDAIVNEPSIQLIKGVHEGAVASMADGFARVSGKPGVVLVAAIGLPNAMTQMVNTVKDHIPMLVAVASAGQDVIGRDGVQDYDFQESMLAPITKWRWTVQSTKGIPETTRRALKFAATPPAGPVFLALPENTLRAQDTGEVIDQALFDVPMQIRPDRAVVERIALMLIEARSPILTVGDEIALCWGEKEVVELAELLGLPVAGRGEWGEWSKPFPTRHPLFLGPFLPRMRYPADIDVQLNIGNRYAEMPVRGGTLISVRQDPAGLARVSPVDIGIVADVRLATIDLIEAVRSIATETRLRRIAQERSARTRDYTRETAKMIEVIAAAASKGPEIRRERLALELEANLERDTIYVTDADSGKHMEPFMAFGGTEKRYIATSPNVLGWALGAAFGVKLAEPDRPVVAVSGDGAMMFSGPQPLWTHARYKAPVITIVYNNRSYNAERNRIWTFFGGDQFKQGRDMTCYNGDPDVNFAKAAEAYGVEAETVKEVSQIKPALERAKRATVEGRPYFLDVHVERDGIGAASAWHPAYSLADVRTRKV
jgi:thiamine pyrophosphate-dependent acetolactate synthase large subunit-like protein